MTGRRLAYEKQIREAKRRLLKLARENEDYPPLIIALEKWGKVADFIDKALLNHGYHILTVPLTYRRLSVFIRYTRDDGDWVLDDVWIGERVGWGYKWEYDLYRDREIVRERMMVENTV